MRPDDRSPSDVAFELASEAARDEAELFYRDLLGLGAPPSRRWRVGNAEDQPAAPVVDPLLERCRASILAMVGRSPVVTYRWPDRGVAPIGFLNGMALTYARVYCKWQASDPFVVEMARRPGGGATDALAWCADLFRGAGLDNSRDGVDTLRHVFVFLFGLGMRESSGDYSEGRDMSANNVSPTSAEAGLFQMSHTVGVGSATIAGGLLRRQYEQLSQRPYPGLVEVFREGVRVRAGRLTGFGTTPGGRFRELCVLEPALGAEIAALGIRKRRRHWGPINRRNVTVSADCDRLLQDVQTCVDREGCCAPATPAGR